MDTRKSAEGFEIIQIAGILDHEEAALLLDHGVDWLGFPFELPVHREDLDRKSAAKIISSLQCSERAVLITYLNLARDIMQLSKELGTERVQIHGDISLDEMEKLRKESGLYVIKSLVVNREPANELEAKLLAFTPFVDAFLTDTYDPETNASGATGKTHDWNVSAHLVRISDKPVFLAGGLNSENVRDAITTVKPAGVDSHTGVEAADGRKDKEKVRQFVSAARDAFGLY